MQGYYEEKEIENLSEKYRISEHKVYLNDGCVFKYYPQYLEAVEEKLSCKDVLLKKICPWKVTVNTIKRWSYFKNDSNDSVIWFDKVEDADDYIRKHIIEVEDAVTEEEIHKFPYEFRNDRHRLF